MELVGLVYVIAVIATLIILYRKHGEDNDERVREGNPDGQMPKVRR